MDLAKANMEAGGAVLGQESFVQAAQGFCPGSGSVPPGSQREAAGKEQASRRGRGLAGWNVCAKRGRRVVALIMRRLAWVGGSFGMLLLLGWICLRFIPLPAGLFEPPKPAVELLDRHGHSLRMARTGDLFATQVSYSEIPQSLIEATLAAEDARFWSHPGMDWRGTLRAAWLIVKHRHVYSGGSTITQQLVKLSSGTGRRTWGNKLVQSLQALRLEQVWSKQRILAEYLNRLDYGNGCQGCGAAAEFYFSKPMRHLSPAECALLAGLPQAPSRLNPYLHRERALKRRQWVLGRMQACGCLEATALGRALAEPLQLAAPRRPFEAPHFADLVLARSGPALTQSTSKSRRVIHTTLDLELNRQVEQILRHHVLLLKKHRVNNASVVVLDNTSGDVLALVGSEDYFSPGAGQVNGAWQPRSAGSTFKPFTYLLAFERGATPATIVADVPSEFATSSGVFSPVNYNRRCYGPMRYRLALANSLNISAVRVLDWIGGPRPLQACLQHCGLTTLTRPPEEYGLGLTIGNAEARLLELANAYGCLARLGEFLPWRLVPGPAAAPVRMADSAAAFLVADILSDSQARTLAFGAESPLRFSFPVACKTGTSSDFRDNWAFGYTPEFTVGVWAGNFDGTPMQEVSGVMGAAPILHDVFELLHKQAGTSWFSKPGSVDECWVHPVTGKRLREPLSSALQAVAVKEKYISSAPPLWESESDFSENGRVRLPGEYRDWLSGPDNYLCETAVLAETNSELRITFPVSGTTFFLDPDLPDQGRRVTLRADGSNAVKWRSDSLQIVSLANRPIALLTEGTHRLEAFDPHTGASATAVIQVLAR
jgi:penicillin-binding protein 1C